MPFRYLVALLCAVAGLVVLVSSFQVAKAQMTPQMKCGKRADIIKFLGNKYQEKKTGMGLMNSGRMLEMFRSRNGTFTILLTSPNGVSCFGPVGKNWSYIDPEFVEDEPA